MSSSKEFIQCELTMNWLQEHNNCSVITYSVDPQKQKVDKNTCSFLKIKARYLNLYFTTH